jgi:hypothetical protein
MSWRLARSLETLRNQLNAKYPRRDRKSDGTIGDARHQAKKSDHNPRDGVVTAFDITEDFKNGPDLPKLLPMLLKDRRVKYVIYEGKLYKPNGEVQKNSGHTQHMHVSVLWDRRDEAQDWVLAPSGSAAQPTATPRQTLKKGMTGGDVPVLQLKLRELGYYSGLVDGNFGPLTLKSVQKAQEALGGLKVDGVVGPKTWAKLAVASPVRLEQSMNEPIALPDPPKPDPVLNAPQWAIALYESLGWSHIQAVALCANLVFESGGNQDNPDTIRFQAHGDKDKGGEYRSHGAGQWNERAGRFGLLKDFATRRGKIWDDPETQLLFLDHELHTTERKAGVALRAAATLEDAVAAAIKIWRPSIPHADRRLAIAKTLL